MVRGHLALLRNLCEKEKHTNAEIFIAGTSQSGAALLSVMLYQFGRSDSPAFTKARTQQNLALASTVINGRKGVWFGGGVPDWTDKGRVKSPRAARFSIRNGAGVFRYLNYQGDGTTEAIWNKWMRVSNWIDLVLYTFDVTYPWGTGAVAGEPTTTGGTASLRALYAFWIDINLGNIETRVKGWAPGAKQYYEGSWYSGNTQAEKDWVALTWNSGMCSLGASGMRFPRPNTGPTVYGAYGNAGMTYLPSGATYNIPVNPTRLTRA